MLLVCRFLVAKVAQVSGELCIILELSWNLLSLVLGPYVRYAASRWAVGFRGGGVDRSLNAGQKEQRWWCDGSVSGRRESWVLIKTARGSSEKLQDRNRERRKQRGDGALVYKEEL